MKLYVNMPLDAAADALFTEGTRGHEVVRGAPIASLLHSGRADDLRDIDVVFGQPDPLSLAASQVRFTQLTSAGWTRFDTPALKATLRARGSLVSNSSSVFAAPVAEHAVAMMLSLSRELAASLDEQRGAHGWPHKTLRGRARVLAGDIVLVLGYGAIARALGERLRGFGCELVGYRRSVRGDETMRTVDARGLPAEWSRADHIVDVLPENEETNHFVDAARLAACKRGARFYNLGRGTTVDQDALVEALRSGPLDAAFLDVTAPEPLPPDDPLWTTPGLYLSPHIAGGHRAELPNLVRHFLANLRRFEAGQALTDRVI